MHPLPPPADGLVSNAFAPTHPASTPPASAPPASALPTSAPPASALPTPTLPDPARPATTTPSLNSPTLAPATPASPTLAPPMTVRRDAQPDLDAPVEMPSWKQRRNRPSRRALRWIVRLLLIAAVVYGAWFAWNWVIGDTFDADPATAPNAYEALDVEFTERHPTSGAQIEVRADLASRQGIARSGNVTIARRDDGLFAREGSAEWRLVEDEEMSSFAPLLAALDGARVLTIDDVFPPAGWAGLEIIEQSAYILDGPDFTARATFDVTTLTQPTDAKHSLPIPRLRVEAPDTPLPGNALVVDVDADVIHPAIADRVGLTGPVRLDVIVDAAGVVHSIRVIDQDSRDESVYDLVDAAIERPRPFDGTGLDDVPRVSPPPAQLDLDMASREAIGPLRFERIVDRTGVTLTWGNTNRRNYDAVATWRGSGAGTTMAIVVSGFHRGGRDDLLAHELAHIAAYGVGIFDGSHECLADIIASHWLGHKVNMGAYDYSRCESHGDARRVLDTYE